MSDVKDYCSESGDKQYRGVSSTYSKRVESQVKMQPKYSEPGPADGNMKGEKANKQAGP